jgi:hypothetical protein
MYPSDPLFAAQNGLRAGWLSLFGRLGQMLSGKARLIEQRVADRVKDALLDLGEEMEDESEPSVPFPLPAMNADRFIEAMQGPVEIALRQSAQRLNEGPGGQTPEKIDEQVHVIFEELARKAIEEAFQQRMTLAENDLPPVGHGGDWARRYRRMMAREGRWPVPLETTESGE